MKLNRPEVKGVFISLGFIIVVSAASLYGVDLGRFFWIVLVFMFLIGVILYPVFTTVRSTQGEPGSKSTDVPENNKSTTNREC